MPEDDAIRWGCLLCNRFMEEPPALEIKVWSDGHTSSVICWECLDRWHVLIEAARKGKVAL